MIVTDLENLPRQVGLTPGLAKAINFLRETRGQDLADGRVEVDGDTVFALVQSYATLDPSQPPLFEAHRRYLDVQYIVSGEEVIGWAPLDRLSVTRPYDEASEAVLGTVAADDMTRVLVPAGFLAVLWPSDAHAPKLSARGPRPVKKIVVKVAVGVG